MDRIAKFDGVEVYTNARFFTFTGCGSGEIKAAPTEVRSLVDEVRAKAPIPFISIVEAACDCAKQRNFKRLALFGTRYTMEADFYQKVFAREGIELVTPEPKDQDYIHEKYFAELVPGVFLPETRAGLLAVLDRMKTKIDPPAREHVTTEQPHALQQIAQ